MKKAFLEAETSFSQFQKEWMDRVNRIPTEQLFEMDIPTPPEGREASWRVAFIGHPYNLFDTDINKDILTLTKKLEMEIMTSDSLSEKEIDQEVFDLSKEIYWSSGREIVGSLFHFLSGGADGLVFLTSSKCGIDALLQEFVKRRLKVRGGSSIPYLILSFDEHTGREGLTTRMEATPPPPAWLRMLHAVAHNVYYVNCVCDAAIIQYQLLARLSRLVRVPNAHSG